MGKGPWPKNNPSADIGFTKEASRRALAKERSHKIRLVRISSVTGIRKQYIKKLSVGHGPSGRLHAFMVFQINHERQMEF